MYSKFCLSFLLQTGMNSLMIAASRGHIEIVKLLLEVGKAVVDSKDNVRVELLYLFCKLLIKIG